MKRTILWFFCGLLVPGYSAVAANAVSPVTTVAPEKPATLPAAGARAVPPLIIPAVKARAKAPPKPSAKAAPKSNQVAAKPTPKSTQPNKSQRAVKAPPVKAKPLKAKPVKAKPVKTKPVKTKPVSSNVANTQLAPVKLNLHLPPESVANMEFGKPLAEVDEVPVLPPMFGQANPAPTAYQLSGKLINRERQKQDSDDYLDSVEGAQLSIEFRQ